MFRDLFLFLSTNFKLGSNIMYLGSPVLYIMYLDCILDKYTNYP